MERVVVVGAGLAGSRTCEELRSQGYDGRLTLLGAEAHPPYDRPPLSKEVLAGTAEDTTLPFDAGALDVDLRLGVRAQALAPGLVETTDGDLAYDGLVIATGATPVRLPGPGTQHVLRTMDDALALRSLLVPGARVAVVGAGWIGAEVATAAVALGCTVTVVEAGPAPLAVALGPELGCRTERWYAEAGVDLRLGTAVREVGVHGLTLSDGELPADVVLTGVGVRPDTGWLAGSPLEVERGVVVDEHLRATGLPDVVAVGDAAAWWSRRFGARLRVEHWDDALRAPEVAAASLLGRDAVHDPVPYFWSHQFGRMIQFRGHRSPGDRLVWRGDPAQPTWAVGWVDDTDRINALLAVGRPKDASQAVGLIAGGAPVPTDRLADPDVAVRDLVPRARPQGAPA